MCINFDEIYTHPQEYDSIIALLSNLEKFINDSIPYDVDPLVKMAIIHLELLVEGNKTK